MIISLTNALTTFAKGAIKGTLDTTKDSAFYNNNAPIPILQWQKGKQKEPSPITLDYSTINPSLHSSLVLLQPESNSWNIFLPRTLKPYNIAPTLEELIDKYSSKLDYQLHK